MLYTCCRCLAVSTLLDSKADQSCLALAELPHHGCWMVDCRYYWGNDNIEYHLKWLDGAKSTHNLTIDYLGELRIHPQTL